MANLLPEEQKKKIRTETVFRFGIVISYSVILTTFVGQVFLAPTQFLVFSKKREVGQQIQSVKGLIDIERRSNTGTLLAEANRNINIINGPEKDVSVLFLVEEIEEARTPGVHVTGIFYTKVDENNSEIIVRGLADRRDQLLSFRDNLEEEQTFDSVDLPISNLVTSTDVEFSLTLTVAGNK